MKRMLRWVPALMLTIAAFVTTGVDAQRVLTLRQPLEAAVPQRFGPYVGHDLVISDAEQEMAGMTDYLFRVFTRGGAETRGDFSIYVGYYAQQTRGQTIHSPKNCLPGAGWEPLSSEVTKVSGIDGPVEVNRYLIQNGQEQALVIYWYQGRGRIQASEYFVKADLLRDAAFRQRSDEALVRIIVPIDDDAEEASRFAARIAEDLIPAVYAALPG